MGFLKNKGLTMSSIFPGNGISQWQHSNNIESGPNADLSLVVSDAEFNVSIITEKANEAVSHLKSSTLILKSRYDKT